MNNQIRDGVTNVFRDHAPCGCEGCREDCQRYALEVLSLSPLKELLALLEQADGNIKRVVVLDSDQSLPRNPYPVGSPDYPAYGDCKATLGKYLRKANFRKVVQP